MKKIINKLLNPFNVELHGKGYLKALSKGDYDKDEFQFMVDYCRPDSVKVIFDVGANFGSITNRFLTDYPNAEIHIFEPLEECHKELVLKYGSNPRVTINQIAISNYSGVADFNVNNNLDTSSLLKSKKIGLNSDVSVMNKTSIEVETTSIMEYCLNNQIDSIDILKFDIQGGELIGLLGAETLLRSKKIGLIYLESYFQQQYEDQPLFYHIGEHLFKYEYYLQDLYSKIYGKDSLVWCDAIFLPKK